ncbi:hypothetical protein Tco_1520393, partial [Tanacetum coccineum]
TRNDSSHSSASSYSTAPLSLDHPFTHVSPTPTPTRVSFHHRTARMVTLRMTVRVQPAMSPGHSARVTEAMALSDSPFRERYRSSYETPSSSSSPTLLMWKRYRGTFELILDTDYERDELGEEDTEEDESDEDHGLDDESQSFKDDGLSLEEEEVVPKGQQQAVTIVGTAASEHLGLGYGALRRRELAVEEDRVPSTSKEGQSSRSVPEQQGAERVFAFRQPTLITWVDPEDDRVYTDVPAYAPQVAHVQTSPSPEWSSGSLPISPSSHVVPSPIASPRLDALPPTLIADIDRDVRELYTRSRVVKDEIFSQRYRFRSLECEEVRTVMTFGALYDDHRLIHDMLVRQAAMQRELQGMRGRVTALEQCRILVILRSTKNNK